jgi:hypothetical protein
VAKRNNARLAGHGLWNEGNPRNGDIGELRRGVGEATCECGAVSPKLPSTSQRRQWHRDHKEAIKTAMGLNGPRGDQ